MESQDGYERWPDGPEEGLWIKVRETLFKVAGFVPSTFEAYARIFHPLKVRRAGLHPHGELLRWHEVAELEGTVMHPQIQIPELLKIASSRVEARRSKGVGIYQRPSDQDWEAVGGILRRHTTSHTFFIGMWEGSGVPEEARHQTPLEQPYRRFYLVELPFERWSNNSIIGRYDASLFWPKDRSWFANTDIDAGSTYVGGTAEAIVEIVESPDLESEEAELDHYVGLY